MGMKTKKGTRFQVEVSDRDIIWTQSFKKQ
jgi:hypothetical protein